MSQEGKMDILGKPYHYMERLNGRWVVRIICPEGIMVYPTSPVTAARDREFTYETGTVSYRVCQWPRHNGEFPKKQRLLSDRNCQWLDQRKLESWESTAGLGGRVGRSEAGRR